MNNVLLKANVGIPYKISSGSLRDEEERVLRLGFDLEVPEDRLTFFRQGTKVYLPLNGYDELLMGTITGVAVSFDDKGVFRDQGPEESDIIIDLVAETVREECELLEIVEAVKITSHAWFQSYPEALSQHVKAENG